MMIRQTTRIWFRTLVRKFLRRTTLAPAHADETGSFCRPDPSPSPVKPNDTAAPVASGVSLARSKRRGELRDLIKKRRKVADTVDDLIDRLAAFRLSRTDIPDRKHLERLIGRLVCCDFFLFDDVTLDRDTSYIAPNQDNARDLVEISWPVDVAMIVRQSAHYFIFRLSSASAPDVRGHVRLVLPRMLNCTCAHVCDNGEWWAEESFFGFIDGRWVPIDRGMVHDVRGGLRRHKPVDPEAAAEAHRTIAMAFSVLLTRRYEWHVALGNAEGPRILLPTSPAGCRAFFSDRVATTGTRRSALRHWVTRHYRDQRDAGTSWVREHLRGATEFLWRGVKGEVLVSAYDLERNEEFRREAEQWRARRHHNSFRVRLRRKENVSRRTSPSEAYQPALS